MEEKRTLTTEYGNTEIVVNTAAETQGEIPQYAIDRVAKFFLKRMQEEYMQNNKTNQ